ncbi:hypothetical protein RM96_27110 [Cupriavidus sp. IDO]|nr:hypothetical protein RM96_27110 [Cupriavidus sp. IDO]
MTDLIPMEDGHRHPWLVALAPAAAAAANVGKRTEPYGRQSYDHYIVGKVSLLVPARFTRRLP